MIFASVLLEVRDREKKFYTVKGEKKKRGEKKRFNKRCTNGVSG